jgi:EmrB/QacA subfamily drug resistance transporter
VSVIVGGRSTISARTAVAVAYVASLLMAALDANVVNVMLPTLTTSFHTSLNAVKWTVLGYILALAIAMPASAWLSARLGDRRVFLASLLLFTAASGACGLATNLPMLVGMRLLQGIGGGLVIPVATAMLYRTYPPSERARLTRMLLLPIAIGPALAPPLGGFLVQQLSWRWAFFVNVPVGLLAATLIVAGLPRDEPGARIRFDAVGFVLAGGGLSALLLVLGDGGAKGWGSPVILTAAVVGVAALATFIVVQLRTTAPLLNVRLLRNGLFRNTNVASGCQSATFLGGLLYVTPIFLQEHGGYSPLAAGAVMSLVPVGVVTSAQTVGRRYGAIGPRRMVVVGEVLLMGVLITMAFLDGHTSIIIFCSLMLLAGLFNGAAMVGLQASMFAQIEPPDTGAASTIFNVNRQLAGAVGVATASVLLTSLHPLGGLNFRAAYFGAATFSLLAAVGASFIDDTEAAATMKPVAAPVAASA